MAKHTSFSVIIPSRYGSTRLSGKPLIDLCGKPMIVRVVEQAFQSAAERVIVATDDQRIVDCLTHSEAEVVMTSRDHLTGSDRLWEVVQNGSFTEEDVIVNVQGDEPLIPPEVINQVANLVSGEDTIGVTTLCEEIAQSADLLNPNVVKVVFDSQQRALYFSRAPIPWDRHRFPIQEHAAMRLGGCYRHLGIYAYRRWALQRFVKLAPSSLETIESLEQLRFLQNGIGIKVEESVAQIPAGVDTKEDVERVRLFLDGNPS